MRSHRGSARFMDSKNSRSAWVRPLRSKWINCARVSSNSRHVNSARVIPANSPSNSYCKGFNAGSRISEIGRPWWPGSAHARRINTPAQSRIRFDFDHSPACTDHELRRVESGRGGDGSPGDLILDRGSDVLKCVANTHERLVSFDQRKESQRDVDGQARQVAHEEIDGRTTLECEDFFASDDRQHPQQERQLLAVRHRAHALLSANSAGTVI